MKKFLVFLAAMSLVFAVVGTASANLLTNGDFETVDHSLGITNGIYLDELANLQWDVYTAIPGWGTWSGTGIEIQRSTIVAAHSPLNYVELDSAWTYPVNGGEPYSNSHMFQMVFLNAGYYDLSFWYRPRTDQVNDNGIDVNWWGPDNTVLTVDGIRSEFPDWVQFSVEVYADYDGLWGLGFEATGIENTLGGFLDDIELNAVPEPATMLLLGSGLIGLGVLGRKKLFKKA